MAFSVLPKRSSPWVTLFVKIANMATNRHKSISHETYAVFVFGVARNALHRVSRLIFSCKCSIRTSFWNEIHSGMKLILVSCEQPLSLYETQDDIIFFDQQCEECLFINVCRSIVHPIKILVNL